MIFATRVITLPLSKDVCFMPGVIRADEADHAHLENQRQLNKYSALHMLLLAAHTRNRASKITSALNVSLQPTGRGNKSHTRVNISVIIQ